MPDDEPVLKNFYEHNAGQREIELLNIKSLPKN